MTEYVGPAGRFWAWEPDIYRNLESFCTEIKKLNNTEGDFWARVLPADDFFFSIWCK